MNRRTRVGFLILAASALASSVSVPGIFLSPLDAFRASNYYDQGVLLVGGIDLLRVLFFVLPIASVVGAIRCKLWTFYCLVSFPVVAWVFGAGAVPLVSHVFPAGLPRTIAVTVINLAVIAFAVWLYRGRSNSSFKPTPLRGAA